ncbi:MAG TPA: ABC transporter ATP-binding protein [Rhodothermales bacterium]
MHDAVVVQSLDKGYGTVQAVSDLAFSVEEGELFGFIGPDGAGKTTLFRILVTLLKPDRGSAIVDGLDVVTDFKRLRRRLGYMPGRFSLYHDLSVKENLTFFASIFGTTVEENYHLVKDIYRQIEPFANRRAGRLSGGMKQKLALSCALIHKPRVLFLDEPTTGVDAVSRQEFWQMLKRLKDDGLTIVVSTPYMDEAAQCDRVALMQNGRLLGIDTPQNISKRFDRPLMAVRTENTYRLLGSLRAYPFAHSVYPFGESVHYTDSRPDVDPTDLERHLRSEGFREVDVHRIEPGIEDVFMALMERQEAA